MSCHVLGLHLMFVIFRFWLSHICTGRHCHFEATKKKNEKDNNNAHRSVCSQRCRFIQILWLIWSHIVITNGISCDRTQTHTSTHRNYLVLYLIANMFVMGWLTFRLAYSAHIGKSTVSAERYDGWNCAKFKWCFLWIAGAEAAAAVKNKMENPWWLRFYFPSNESITLNDAPFRRMKHVE